MTGSAKPWKAAHCSAGSLTRGESASFEVGRLDLRGKGVFFDEHIDLADPVGSEFVALVLNILDGAKERKRKRGAAAAKALTLRVRKILANAMRAHFFREIPAVLYFAKADAVEYATKPQWMRHGNLGETIRELETLDLLERIKGKKMPWWSDTPSWASSFSPTRKLIFLSRRCRVHAGLIKYQLAADELVQLYAPKEAKQFDRLKGELVQPRKGRPIDFEPTMETEEWTNGLLAINAFYEKQAISLGLPRVDLDRCPYDLCADSDRKESPCRLPETFRSQLYRVFNNGNKEAPSFEQGGRLFGGWWMQLPEFLREHITINGRPTVELDYAECHPRMLYHQRGHDGDGELYSIPEVSDYETENGENPETYRPCIKWLTQVLINGRGRPELTPPPEDVIFPPHLSLKQIVQYIEARHYPIADAFRTGAGLYLMRSESDIAFEIITAAMKEGWVVLPVHDSFITTVEHREDLRELMMGSYAESFGKEPVLKE